MNGGHQEINQIRAIVQGRQLDRYSEENLKRMVIVIDSYLGGLDDIMSRGLAEPVKSQLERVQRERHQKESRSELNRIHQEQMVEVKRMFAESNSASDEKHAESLSISNEANALSKKAIGIAWLSVLATVIIGVIGVVVAHLDSNRTSTSDTNAPRIKETASQSTTPQIVAPTPKPTPTNLIPTNAVPKK